MTRVLIVDDEESVRFMVSFVLDEQGITSEQARSGDEALEALARGAFDLVVLDHRMPGLTGVEVLQEMRARGDETPVVVHSAYIDETLEIELEALGVPAVDKADTERLVDFLVNLAA